MSNEVTVTSAALSGFAKDLTDAGESLLSNTSRATSGLSLKTGTGGLLATIAPSLQDFSSAVSALSSKNNDQIQQLGSNLTTTVRNFQQQDTTWARAVNSLSGLSLPSQAGTSAEILRFRGMQSLHLPDVQSGSLTLSATVTAVRDTIAIFDDRLQKSIGIKPAEKYLTPLIGDWETLQTFGQWIRHLAGNDTLTAGNLSNGSHWLTSQWSGDAARSYSNAISTLQSSIFERGTDMDSIAKTLEKAGECLERLVYNQAAGIATGLMEQLSIMGFTLPVGMWAQIVDRPMPETAKNQITEKMDAIRTQADSRETSIGELVDRVRSALKYEPGTTVAQPAGNLFVVPGKVVADLTTLRYGFNDNVWFQHSLASAL
ncbi:hypothetical protein K7711_41955 [Nocardia sp. CA2R105]|uniref:type VII secretion target n=1 Tax=Nocardia coffeae TaxID=2873381 RepID=UPI001CA77416|nr:type VII secretion target [Nocardia coffeae]MBY8863092.1 hypothetical protein [Nocardia coffeae]